MAGSKGTLAEVPGGAGDEAERAPRRSDATHLRGDPLANSHMPRDFRVSLETYRRGGTDEFLASAPDHLEQQPMKGFEEQYRNIVDYIVRITHRIWEEKDIGYLVSAEKTPFLEFEPASAVKFDPDLTGGFGVKWTWSATFGGKRRAGGDFGAHIGDFRKYRAWRAAGSPVRAALAGFPGDVRQLFVAGT